MAGCTKLALSLLALSLLALAASCGGTTQLTTSKGTKSRVLEPDDPAADAQRWRGKRCAIDGENLSGRGDPQACGPFPCDAGECVVNTCGADGSCYPGFCVRGHCVRPAEQGSRTCDALPKGDASDAALLERGGCSCFPQSASKMRDAQACGGFPCGPDGCYVAACKRDEDCAFGLCSSHASGPHGYCVTDDPI